MPIGAKAFAPQRASVGPLSVCACGATTLNPVGLYYLSQDNAPQAHRGGVRLQGGPAGPLVHRVKQQNGIVLLLSN